MTARFSLREQLGLIAHLRWRLLVNSLGSLRGRVDLISYVLVWLMMAGLMLAGGLVFGLGVYFLLARGEAVRIAFLFWAAFLFWQLYPILVGSASGGPFDFSNLLRFPLRYSAYGTLSLLFGLLDPSAVVASFWLLCLALGCAAFRATLLPGALLVVLLFGAMNLVLARAIATWADRWMAHRRSREILGMLFVLIIVGGDLAANLWGPSALASRSHAAWLGAVVAVARWLPPGAAGSALSLVSPGSPLLGLAGLVLLCLYTLAFLWLLHVRLVAQYRGENLSEAQAPAAAVRRAPAIASRVRPRPLPLLSGITGALLEREATYTLRNWRLLLQFLIIPAFFFVFIVPNSRHGNPFTRHSALIFPMAAAWAFFSETYWFFNCFGFDGAGIRFLLLAPVRFRQIMLGKNLFQAAATFLNIFVLWICVRSVFGPQKLFIVAVTLLACLFALFGNLAVGNVMSLCFPKRMDLGGLRQSRAMSGTSIAVGLVTQAVLFGLGAAAFLVASVLARPSLAALILFVLAALTCLCYLLVLSRVDGIAARRRETLTDELCKSSPA